MNPTPEQLKEMWEWYQARKVQQLSYPVDDASRNALGVVTRVGPGPTSDLTDTISITIGPGGGSDTADVPKAYAGSVLLNIDGANYEVPYL